MRFNFDVLRPAEEEHENYRMHLRLVSSDVTTNRVRR